MSRVLVLVEGQTERAVIDHFIGAHLGVRGVYLHPRIVGRPGHKGGIRRFEAVRGDLLRLLRQEPSSVVTTMFDYYRLPKDWPGLDQSRKAPLKAQRPGIIEAAMKEDIAEAMDSSSNPSRFEPYIQLHELESLLFAGPEEMAEVFGRPKLATHFQEIVERCGGCEEIDDDPNSTPAERIKKFYPSYKKGKTDLAHAHRIVQRIGMDRIRRACPHFSDWIEWLLSLVS